MTEDVLGTSLGLTAALAAATTAALLILAPPLAWWLAHTKRRGASFIEALVALPLVLPPTVLGFYLLLAMAEDAWLGASWRSLTGQPLAFTFSGLVLASIIYSLPFVSQPLTASFRNTPAELLDAALGHGRCANGPLPALSCCPCTGGRWWRPECSVSPTPWANSASC